MRKKCIFCQRDDQKISKEHILPDWLNKLYGEDMTALNEGVRDDGTILYSYTSKIFQQTVNIVCKSCNNGWMSEMENTAKPILTKMLKNKNIVLDKKSQIKIANWAMKTILVMNHNNPAPPERPIIPRSQYSKFYEDKSVSKDNLILLGYQAPKKYKPGERIASNWITAAENIQVHKNDVAKVRKLKDAGGRVYGITFSLDGLVFQMIGNDLGPDNGHKVEMIIPEEPLRVLNPHVRKIRWPLNHAVDEIGGLEVLHDALKGGIMPR